MPKFGKTSRISSAEDFLNVKKRGKSVRSGKLIAAATSGARRRLGIIVTRRVGNAVERNRLKRVIRDFFRKNRDLFPKGDCVIIPTTGAKDVTNDALRASLSRALDLLADKLKPVIREAR